MCQVLDNFLRNLQDVEIQADSLRVHLLQVERELAQVEGERSRCEEEGAALAGSREHRRAEASCKEVQLELLQHKEAALKRLLAREREHLRTENSQAKQLQEKVFSERTEFCDQVWQFSEYITTQEKKDDLAIKSDEKKVNEEITQLENKKSAIEAELNGLNTRLDAVSKQVDKANIEMEELESFIMAKEFLELEKNLHSILEENKILEKVFNTLITEVDNTNKVKTENKRLKLIENANMYTDEGVISSRKKVYSYTFETVEELASCIKHSNPSLQLSSTSDDRLREKSNKSHNLSQKFIRDDHTFQKDIEHFQNEDKLILNDSTVDRTIHFLDGGRKSDRYCRYPGLLPKKISFSDLEQERLWTSVSRNFGAADVNSHSVLNRDNAFKVHENPFIPVTATNQYQQHHNLNLCSVNNHSQEANYLHSECLSEHHRSRQMKYPVSLKGSDTWESSDECYVADKHSRPYQRPDGPQNGVEASRTCCGDGDHYWAAGRLPRPGVRRPEARPWDPRCADHARFSRHEQPAPYRPWRVGSNDVSGAVTVGMDCRQLPDGEADATRWSNEINKENNMPGYIGTWRPKVRVANKLPVFGNANSNDI